MSAELAAKLVPNNARVINDPAVPEATLVLFTDYQCPYCAHMDAVIQQAKNDYHDQLRIVVRNFPLSMHENSKAAAQAVEAAAEQDALEEISAYIFDNQDDWNGRRAGIAEVFINYAQKLHLDPTKFRADFASQKIKERVENDLQDALELGLEGTPTLVLDGRILAVDPTNYLTLQKPLDQSLAD